MAVANVNVKAQFNMDSIKINHSNKKRAKDYRPAKRMRLYNKNPYKDQYVSTAIDFTGSEDLDALIKEDFTKVMVNDYILRFTKGFFNALHVYAYLSGKEPLHSDAIPIEDKMCINAICDSLGVCRMYETVESRTLDEYDVSDIKTRPIVTQVLLDMASKEFPVEFPEPTVETFSDDDIEVIDIEENVVKEAKSKQNETSQEEKKPKAEVKVEVTVETTSEEPVKEKSDEVEVVDTVAEEVKPESETKEEKVEQIKEKLDNVLMFTVKEDNPDDLKKEAITFDPEKMTLYPNEPSRELTDGQKKWFDISFGEYLKGRDYQLNRIKSGAIECVLKGDGGFAIYYIDPNLCIGNGYNVLGNIETGNPNQPLDTIPVHYSEKEICKKVFDNKGYILTPDEVQKCMSHMFANQRIYNVIDMSNMFQRLKKLSEDDFKKLGKKFTFIINCLPVESIGRMRVNEWKSINKFSLISDEKVKSPFPGQTRDNVTGVKATVNGDKVSITIGSDTTEYTIEDYNVL